MSDAATVPVGASTGDAQTKLPRTPPQILGPFYPFMNKPLETGDLTENGAARGTVLYLSGRVLTETGAPVPDAKVEIWQANADGRYDHPNDDNPAPLDAKFHGFAVTRTDAQGRYHFKTIRPSPYPAAPGRWRPAHIHFQVTAKYEQLVTQMYFKDGAYNDTDTWLNSALRRELLIVDPQPIPGREPGALAVTFDLVINRG